MKRLVLHLFKKKRDNKKLDLGPTSEAQPDLTQITLRPAPTCVHSGSSIFNSTWTIWIFQKLAPSGLTSLRRRLIRTKTSHKHLVTESRKKKKKKIEERGFFFFFKNFQFLHRKLQWQWVQSHKLSFHICLYRRLFICLFVWVFTARNRMWRIVAVPHYPSEMFESNPRLYQAQHCSHLC